MLARAALIAAVVAAAEILLGFGPGHFIIRERAEPDAFLAFRPWLVVLAVLATGQWRGGWMGPLAGAALFIFAASVAEWLVMTLTGVPDAGVLIRAALMSLALALGAAGVAAVFGRLLDGRVLAGMAALLFLAGALALRPPMPSAMALFEKGLRPAAADAAPGRPKALMLTDLPLVWGEGAPDQIARGEARPPAAWRAMNRVADIRPIDAVDGKSWDGARLLILAQPRALRPAELARVDDWVRGGGAAVVFADPELRWAEALRGAVLRPPARSLLGPLTRHWGMEIIFGSRGWRLVAGRLAVVDPGMIAQAPPSCRVSAERLVADCRIGRGRAVVVADADLLDDAAWAGPGGTSRAARTADNAVFVQQVMRSALGLPPLDEPADAVRWMTRPRPAGLLLAAGLAIPALLGVAGLAGRLRRA